MKLLKSALLWAGLFTLPIVAQDVHTDYDRSVPFERYNTYCIGKIHASNQIVENRVRGIIAGDLNRRGFQQSTAGSCDMIVGAIGQVHMRQEYSTFYNGFGPGWGWGGWGVGWGWGWSGGPSMTTVDQIPVGTLIIDVFDAKSKNLIFRGTSQQDISNNSNKNIDRTNKAVDRIFAGFPDHGKR